MATGFSRTAATTTPSTSMMKYWRTNYNNNNNTPNHINQRGTAHVNNLDGRQSFDNLFEKNHFINGLKKISGNNTLRRKKFRFSFFYFNIHRTLFFFPVLLFLNIIFIMTINYCDTEIAKRNPKTNIYFIEKFKFCCLNKDFWKWIFCIEICIKRQSFVARLFSISKTSSEIYILRDILPTIKPIMKPRKCFEMGKRDPTPPNFIDAKTKRKINIKLKTV